MTSHMIEEGGVTVMDKCEPREVKKEGSGLAVSWYDSLQDKTFKV